MKKLKAAWKWTLDHPAQFQSIVLVITIMVTILLGVIDKFEVAVVMLLSLIAGDLVFVIFRYLEELRKDLHCTLPRNLWVVSDKDWKPLEAMQRATRDVFFSGSAMGKMQDGTFSDGIPEGKAVRLLCMDCEQDAIVEAFIRMRHTERNVFEVQNSYMGFRQLLSRNIFQQNKSITARVVDYVLPTVFLAVDIQGDPTPESSIWVKHYMHGVNSKNCVHLLVKPENELYEKYRIEIEKLWADAKELQVSTIPQSQQTRL